MYFEFIFHFGYPSPMYAGESPLGLKLGIGDSCLFWSRLGGVLLVDGEENLEEVGYVEGGDLFGVLFAY